MIHCRTCGTPTKHLVIGKYSRSGNDVLQCQSCQEIALPFGECINIIVLPNNIEVNHTEQIDIRMQSPTKISIDKRHDHYWIQNEILHESYHTIRGLRWREVLKVPGMADDNNCSLDCLNYITKNYLE